jgi:1-deoxy-D-xylulose-5-phosphate reductoisomerase
MVEYEDGGIIAQLGVPDMRLPIQYALYYPERRPMGGNKMDFYELGQMTFERPDMENFPALGLAYEAIRKGGNIPTAFNAADELAVQAFLKKEIRYPEIMEMIRYSMDNCRLLERPTINEVFETEKEVQELLAGWKA